MHREFKHGRDWSMVLSSYDFLSSGNMGLTEGRVFSEKLDGNQLLK
jgi:hypothetical protein